ncbi:putative ribonuclease H protein [Trifolium medium]|uniref:Putative ribonuclease H protein n=1 Tax=Trifolium medium TaxID=97028 RepID=A0A392M697_9FABA|nr:putative ribonuclease H protein [Trifolium medium]
MHPDERKAKVFDLKLANWKARQLSFAGRVTLAKSVIEAIPIYPMMTNKIPKSCLEEIQKLQRNFIWGDRDGVKKYHAIGWEMVTKPKDCGGLGLRRLEVMNQACILKLSWKLASGAKDCWFEVLRGKYDCRALKGEISVKNSASSLWKVMVNLSPQLHNLCFWVVGDGTEIEAWQHAWINEGLRVVEKVAVIPDDLKNIKVSELVDVNGSWNWNMFQGWMPQELKNRIAAILPPSAANGKE